MWVRERKSSLEKVRETQAEKNKRNGALPSTVSGKWEWSHPWEAGLCSIACLPALTCSPFGICKHTANITRRHCGKSLPSKATRPSSGGPSQGPHTACRSGAGACNGAIATWNVLTWNKQGLAHGASAWISHLHWGKRLEGNYSICYIGGPLLVSLIPP